MYFAYASCDTTFCGNDWVGQGVECAGVSGCPCTAKNGTTMVTSGTWMEDVPNIGDWCSAWDGDFNYCAGGGDSFGSEFGADWCADDWCYVDPDDCDKDTYPSTYFNETAYFAYGTCDTTFCGNDWVGQGVECD